MIADDLHNMNVADSHNKAYNGDDKLQQAYDNGNVLMGDIRSSHIYIHAGHNSDDFDGGHDRNYRF